MERSKPWGSITQFALLAVSVLLLVWLLVQSLIWGWAYLQWKGISLVVGTALWITLAVYVKGIRGGNAFSVIITALTYYLLAAEIVFSRLSHKYHDLPPWTFLAVYGTIFTLALLEFGGQVLNNVFYDQKPPTGDNTPVEKEVSENICSQKTFKENGNN